MNVILDASVMLAWLLPDEYGDVFNSLIKSDTALYVPAHWLVEVLNGMLMALRRGRLGMKDFQACKDKLRSFQAMIMTASHEFDMDVVDDIAQAHHLTIYDAIYLALAQQQRAHLATLDDAMMNAARKLKIKLLAAR